MPRLETSKTGWTKTPNRLLDETARVGADLPARHRAVLDLLVREILGWHAEAVAIPQTDLAARLRISTRTLRDALGDLVRWRILRRSGAGQGRVATLELLEPEGWRISRTSRAIVRAETRRRRRGGDQPLLPFPGVAAVLETPSQIRVTSRDTSRAMPRGFGGAHLLEKRKKKERCLERGSRGSVAPTLSRPEVPMPNGPTHDLPPGTDAGAYRRRRAAVIRLRWRTEARGRARHRFEDYEIDTEAARLGPYEVDATFAELDERLAEQTRIQRGLARAEAIRHETRI